MMYINSVYKYIINIHIAFVFCKLEVHIQYWLGLCLLYRRQNAMSGQHPTFMVVFLCLQTLLAHGSIHIYVYLCMLETTLCMSGVYERTFMLTSLEILIRV